MKNLPSRIKFNPITREIEIEGSEKFVRTYFDKIQSLITTSAPEVEKVHTKQEITKTKKTAVLKTPVRTSKRARRREPGSEAVVAAIKEQPEGITTKEISQKTGIPERQIRTIVYRAEKKGLIKKLKRGVYIGA
ncbi:MAG: type IV toxin-antitoxin system AbiEi family antitoxin domain-containing protein [Syntrophales bacterium]|nr:type IV toxin-antitoxin system AbiEi family antitoxin domain-containing protein [Syntrophales bacterium]